mmetsp:Transcript_92796/g.207803  ORF Transcript_92796/g.207803 Transcript_92796/m.207803 type:complete len:490 (+) Transcript_92796:653-2122(+)
MRQLAISGHPIEVAEDSAYVVLAVVQDLLQALGGLLADSSEVLQHQLSRARRLEVLQESLVEHARKDVGHQDVVQHGLAQEDAASTETVRIFGAFSEPVGALVLVVLEEADRATPVQEAPEDHLEELLGHPRTGTLLALERDTQRSAQLAVTEALELREHVLDKPRRISSDLDLQWYDSTHLQLDLFPDVAEETDAPKTHRHKVVVREEGAEVSRQPKAVDGQHVRDFRAGVLSPPLPFRDGLALVDALQNEVVILHFGASGALLVQPPGVTRQRVRRVEKLQQPDGVPELPVGLDVLHVLDVHNLCVDHVDDNSDELVEHGSGPFEGKLVRESHPLCWSQVEHMHGQVLRDGDDPDESLVPSIPVLVICMLEEGLEDLLELAVAVLTEVYVAVLGAVVEVTVHNAGLAVVADLVGAECQTARASEVEGVLVRLLPLHAMPMRYDADAVGIAWQCIRHQGQECRQEGRSPTTRRVATHSSWTRCRCRRR